MFLLEPDAQGPDEMFTDRDHGARQESFRHRLRSSGLTVVMVSSPIQLDKAAFQALIELRTLGAGESGPGVITEIRGSAGNWRTLPPRSGVR